MKKNEIRDLLEYSRQYRKGSLSTYGTPGAIRGLEILKQIPDEYEPGDAWADVAESLAREWT